MKPAQIEDDLSDNPRKKMLIYSDEIRREKRYKILSKRRCDFSLKTVAQDKMIIEDKIRSEKEEEIKQKHAEFAEKYKNTFKDVVGGIEDEQERALITVRKLSEADTDFTLALPFQEELITKLLELTTFKDNFQIQLSSVKIIANLSSGCQTNCKILIENDTHKYLARSIKEFRNEITEQLLLAFGNLVGESVQYRDLCLEFGTEDLIIDYVVRFKSRNGIWALCNLVRGVPGPDRLFCKKAFPLLLKKATAKIDDLNSLEMAQDCLWTVEELTMRSETIDLVTNEPRYLLELAEAFSNATKYSILQPLFQIFENLVASKMKICLQFFIEFLLPKFSERILAVIDLQYRISILKIIQLVVAEDVVISNALIDSGMMTSLIKMIRTDHKEVSKEAAWTLCKFVKYGTFEQIEKLVTLGLLESICDSLWDSDVQLVIYLLDTIEGVLHSGKKTTYFSDKLQTIGGVLKLEQLQDSNNDQIYKKILRILETFFETEEL